MATDGQVVIAATRWSDETLYLRELTEKTNFPAVVKFTKGQYGGLGVPSLPNPGLHPIALLVSAGTKHKIVAQAIKLKEGRRVANLGPRIIIPESYKGYFELLSEEGKAARCIESVVELSRRKSEAGFLVREQIRGIAAKVVSDGKLEGDGPRNVYPGETLQPVSVTQISGNKNKYLHCIDSKGDIVLLNLDQRGKFSPLAKKDNISGVHTVKNLLTKRLPVTVRLVFGSPPKNQKGHFVPELRLIDSYEEAHVFALPLQKDVGHVIPLPLNSSLKLQTAKNVELLRSLKEYQRLVERCQDLIGDIEDRSYIVEGKLREHKSHSTELLQKPGYLRRTVSSESTSQPNSPVQSNENRAPLVIGKDYDDIDQIYDYVRGFAPLPKSLCSQFVEQPVEQSSSPKNQPGKPQPPPIETIPTKKISNSPVKAEKRSRREVSREGSQRREAVNLAGSVYLKNAYVHQGRILKHKSSSPLKEQVFYGSKHISPVFSIRYKSLNNLQQGLEKSENQIMELDGTLDSSHSDGRTSGDSGAKLPQKRFRCLRRPVSLTNLAWEPCPSNTPDSYLKPSNPHRLPHSHHSKRIGTLYF